MSIPKVSVLLSLYKAERFLSNYLQNVLDQGLGDSIELSIVHNNPTNSERMILDKFSSKILMIRSEVSRENLYKSWNRAIAQSSGEYLATWNVDDLRSNESLKIMIDTLDRDPSIGWTYGDFIITNTYASKKGINVISPVWTKELGTRGAIGGPFFMWRKSLISSVGLFDEQFKSGGDFDYTVRLSLKSNGAKTKGLIGYFLNENSGLSTATDIQPIERTVIQLRYGIYETLDLYYIQASFTYRVRHILQPNGSWLPIEKLVGNYDLLIDKRKHAIWYIPLYTFKSALQRRIARIIKR